MKIDLKKYGIPGIVLCVTMLCFFLCIGGYLWFVRHKAFGMMLCLVTTLVVVIFVIIPSLSKRQRVLEGYTEIEQAQLSHLGGEVFRSAGKSVAAFGTGFFVVGAAITAVIVRAIMRDNSSPFFTTAAEMMSMPENGAFSFACIFGPFFALIGLELIVMYCSDRAEIGRIKEHGVMHIAKIIEYRLDAYCGADGANGLLGLRYFDRGVVRERWCRAENVRCSADLPGKTLYFWEYDGQLATDGVVRDEYVPEEERLMNFVPEYDTQTVFMDCPFCGAQVTVPVGYSERCGCCGKYVRYTDDPEKSLYIKYKDDLRKANGALR